MSVFESLLNNTFTISRRVRTSDGQGGWAISYEDIGSVEGRLRPASGAEREVAAQEERQITHVLYVVASAHISGTSEDIQRGDQVEGDGVIVEVMGVREPSRAGHHLEIDCLEIQHEAAGEAGS